jgi:hypothetical protein
VAKVPKKQIKNNMTLIPSDYISVVIGGLKRSFSRSPIVRDFLKKNRREEDWFKKDGTKASKKHVFYTCAYCKQEFNSTKIQVDHIEPVVPLNIPAKHMSMDMFIERLFVDEDKLQILCKAHHKEKSNSENQIRKEWLTKTKYIVYQTCNRINNKTYIGVHKCQDFDDGYIGSGTLLNMAIKKYGHSAFYRYVLYCFDNPEDAYNKEKELVNDEWIANDNTYNVVEGGVGNKNDAYTGSSKRIICHQTGQIFNSVASAANSLSISASSISKALNRPDVPVRNLHFFTTDIYDPNIKVTFPSSGSIKSIVHLNTRTTYSSIEEAASALSLNYKSLINALLVKTEDNVYALQNNYFLYDYQYSHDMAFNIRHKKVLCVELNKIFDTCTDAAKFLKHKNPPHGGIAIGKAIRTNTKSYRYTWKYIETIETL